MCLHLHFGLPQIILHSRVETLQGVHINSGSDVLHSPKRVHMLAADDNPKQAASPPSLQASRRPRPLFYL
jgi:hypothetical protein